MLSAEKLVEEMAIEIGILPAHLRSIIRTAPLRYKVFHIPKRNGGLREVAQPAREVKRIQRWLVARLEPHLPIHDVASAYRAGASIKKNAIPHVCSNYFLKMDLRDFFPSVLNSDVVRHLDTYCGQVFNQEAIKLIAYVCTWAPKRQGPLRLCIGAPSSPILSNSILFDFDTKLSTVAADDEVSYTRYADDLTLSSSRPVVLRGYPILIKDLLSGLEYPRLAINEKKTVFASRAERRVIAGVTLTPDHRLSIGRHRKREIRAMYHRMLLGKLNFEESLKLRGFISFGNDIEPGFEDWLKKTAR